MGIRVYISANSGNQKVNIFHMKIYKRQPKGETNFSWKSTKGNQKVKQFQFEINTESLSVDRSIYHPTRRRTLNSESLGLLHTKSKSTVRVSVCELFNNQQ